MGQKRVTLSCVIRENQDPNYNGEDDEDYDFDQLFINCDMLSGLVYKTDARSLHQLIHGFVQGGGSDTWIKHREKKRDWRVNFKALQAHYGGKGNTCV